MIDDTTAMRLAIEASRHALAGGNMPFGATLLSRAGELMHVAGNNQATSGDFGGHAEMVLLREAIEGPLLRDEAVRVLRQV